MVLVILALSCSLGYCLFGRHRKTNHRMDGNGAAGPPLEMLEVPCPPLIHPAEITAAADIQIESESIAVAVIVAPKNNNATAADSDNTVVVHKALFPAKGNDQ